MRDDEVGEVGRLLDRAQGLGRALEAADQIHDRAHDQELRRQVPSRTSCQRPIMVPKKFTSTVHTGMISSMEVMIAMRLGPVGDRAVEIMMDADEGIEQRERPEADQRELVGVDRIAHADRQEIVDQHVAGRREPQPDDVVDVEAVEGRAVDAGDRVGQDELPSTRFIVVQTKAPIRYQSAT